MHLWLRFRRKLASFLFWISYHFMSASLRVDIDWQDKMDLDEMKKNAIDIEEKK